ncbi:MAG: ABC transporter permease subunit [Ruminococcaceae bacterium]|nr:ABC transporter permease subunit [Oscillospiraceae bacterium]
MTSIIKPTKFKRICCKILKYVAVTAFWILIWEAASRILSRENELMLLLLPGPFKVFGTLTEMCRTKAFFVSVGASLLRVFTGFLWGAVGGFLFGVATHLSKIVDSLFNPIFKIIRAVPVVAFIILLYLFLESDAVPEVIVVLMVLPIMWQTTHDGLNNPDKRLSEMATVFELGRFKKLYYIDLPQISPQIISTAVTGLGLAWKSGIAAEVICETGGSLGELLKSGKETMNYDETYAVTLTVIILSIIIEFFFKGVFRFWGDRRVKKHG